MICPPVSDPIFSIVVPTFRRPLALTALLKAIRGNRFPPTQYEVIVVDDSGDGDLEDVLAPFRECYPLIALRTPHLGPAPARQAGIDLAKGAYLAFTDDDCIPDPNWLSELHSALLKNPGCAVAGSLFNGLPDNRYSSASQTILDYVLKQHATAEVEFVATANVAFPAAAFRTIGGLDRSWQIWGGEDRDLCRRWRNSGRRFILHAPARIRHDHPLTLRSFWNQHFRYGCGAGRFHRTSPFPQSGFYSGLVAAGFGDPQSHSRFATGSLVLLSQLATGCGFVSERLRIY